MSTCGRIFIEFCLLNTGRSHKTKIAKNITVLLSRVKGKGGIRVESGLHGRFCKRQIFPPLGSPSPLQHSRKVASAAYKRVQQPVCTKKNRERPVERVLSTCMHSPTWEMHLLVQDGTGSWNLGFRGPTHGEDWVWPQKVGLKLL